MKKEIPFSGYCPTKDKETKVYISYLDATTYEDAKPIYIKGMNRCSVDCNIKCPIWENAPQEV